MKAAGQSPRHATGLGGRDRNRFFTGLLAAAAVALFASHAIAVDDASDAYVRGRLIATGGGPGGAASACITCHGRNAEGQAVSGFPRLAGLDRRYQARQLDDYASGARGDPIMSPIARGLDAEDRQAVSIYHALASGRAAVAAERRPDAGLLQQGGVIYAVGAPAQGIQACANCHGPSGRGLPPGYPALAGQNAAYIQEQLRRFRGDTRRNDQGAVMRVIAGRMTDRQIEGVAAYLEALDRSRGGPRLATGETGP